MLEHGLFTRCARGNVIRCGAAVDALCGQVTGNDSDAHLWLVMVLMLVVVVVVVVGGCLVGLLVWYMALRCGSPLSSRFYYCMHGETFEIKGQMSKMLCVAVCVCVREGKEGESEGGGDASCGCVDVRCMYVFVSVYWWTEWLHMLRSLTTIRRITRAELILASEHRANMDL